MTFDLFVASSNGGVACPSCVFVDPLQRLVVTKLGSYPRAPDRCRFGQRTSRAIDEVSVGIILELPSEFFSIACFFALTIGQGVSDQGIISWALSNWRSYITLLRSVRV